MPLKYACMHRSAEDMLLEGKILKKWVFYFQLQYDMDAPVPLDVPLQLTIRATGPGSFKVGFLYELSFSLAEAGKAPA